MYKNHLVLCVFFLLVFVGNVNGSRSKTVIAMGVVSEMSIACETFKLDVGRYPSTSEGLQALIIRPEKIEKTTWQGPYCGREMIPQDPWGNSYQYRYPGLNNSDKFDLFSFGGDGVSISHGNDSDDINNWSDQSGIIPLISKGFALIAAFLIIFFTIKKKF